MNYFTVFAVLCIAIPANADERPNIVWISCEDISPHLGCYGDPDATTPFLDAFANEGVRYTRAFTCHGVCAPSRTGIITGMYPIGIGANHMRSKVALPDHIRCFPFYLREAGYYCTNNSKTDYNFTWDKDDVWDESSNKAHWKNRPDKDQPFFSVFNITTTHESKIWPKGWEKVVRDLPAELRHDASQVSVPELFPETDETRAAHARLLDIITVMDRKVGRYLAEIEKSGLADSTIVIFWSDHGDGFPRAKRWIYDSGTRVPMLVRVPLKWRVDGQGQPETVDNQLINLIDLAPTVLNLAGVDIPDHMFGRPFLGKALPKPREFIHGARDRVDERFDMVRSVRDNRFRYVRNYNTWRPTLQHIQYAETSMIRKEMRRLDREGELQLHNTRMLNAVRPPEELYDLTTDPWELNNLASSPEYSETVQRLAAECDRWQAQVRDVHLIPEIILDAEEREFGNRWRILHKSGGTRNEGMRRFQRLNKLAKLANNNPAEHAEELLAFASHPDAATRWWAITGLANSGIRKDTVMSVMENAVVDESAAVRIAAARAFSRLGQADEAVDYLVSELEDPNTFVQHAALVELDEMGPAASRAAPVIRKFASNKDYSGRVARHASRFDVEQ